MKTPYNALAVFGRIAVGVEGISCILLAIFMLVAGSYLLGMKTTRHHARVLEVTCQSTTCNVTVGYELNGRSFVGSFVAPFGEMYTPGTMTTIRVNDGNPEKIYEDVPVKLTGGGLIVSAVAIGALAWFAFHLVSDSRNLAALAGGVTFLKLAFL